MKTKKAKIITKPQTLLRILMLVVCLELSPKAKAVIPAPPGGYPGGNTAVGTKALLRLTTGTFNTAVGVYSLLSLTEKKFNTAIGAGTLVSS
ncbi:MAG TPA: hypothetical protein VKB46_23355, partial [Pyrinomonadaceae bacterium]|nr:hypothetical protein [Pyrinomonadaceae bacterium]